MPTNVSARRPRRPQALTRRHAVTAEALEGRRLLALTPLPAARADLPFDIGRSVADPVRNVVYAVDSTNHKVIAIDTALGRKVSDARLNGVGDSIAVSPDGSRLYVAQPSTSQIAAFALPNLTPLPAISVGQAFSNLVAGAGNTLYGTTSEGYSRNAMRQVDLNTGGVSSPITLPIANYATLLRTNAAGTAVYARSLHLSGGGGIDQFDVSNPANPTYVRTIPSNSANGQDFVVDEAGRRIYTSDGGVYGVGVVNLDTNAGAFWPIGSYGSSVATREDVPYVFGMTYDGVQRFEKSTGIGLNYNSFGFLDARIESLKMTPNGRVTFTSGRAMTLLGGPTTLAVAEVPTARFTVAANGSKLYTFDGTSSSAYRAQDGIESFEWEFSDGFTSNQPSINRYLPGGLSGSAKLTVTSTTGYTDELVLDLGQTTLEDVTLGFQHSVPKEGTDRVYLSSYLSGLSEGQSIIRWEYDFDYKNSTFTSDSSGTEPSVFASYSNVDGPSTRSVAIRVTDNFGNAAIRVQPMTFANVAPTATFAATSTSSASQQSVAFSNAWDVSLADRAAGFKYSFDFNYDGDFDDVGDVKDSTSASASFNYLSAGTYKVGGRIADKDGGFTDYSTFVTVAANSNIAAGKAATATGTAAGSSPANAVDSSFGTEWVAASNATSATWQIDLGGFYRLSSIIPLFGNGVPDSFSVETSNNANAWTAVRSYSGNLASSVTIDAGNAVARYIRINFTQQRNNWAYRLSEFRVYGTATTPPAPVVRFDNTGVNEGGTQTIFAGGGQMATGQGIVSYEYDFDYDGTHFDVDATGRLPVFDATNLDGPVTRRIAARLTDNFGQVSIGSIPFTIRNVAPTAVLSLAANADGSATATFSNATDVSVADRAAGFRYSFDFNNDGDYTDAGDVLDSTSPAATFKFATSGTYAIRTRVTDKDGGALEGVKSIYVTVPPLPPPTGVPAKLAGSVIGTPGSYDNLGNTIAKVFDGDLNTFFDSNLPIAWAGLDFGVARTITSFRFAPRASWAASRMVGGRFEASNSADFSDSVTLLTITSTPKDKVLTSVEVSTATAYRYFRYISAANGSGNIAELEVYGLTGSTPTQPPTTPPTTPPTGDAALTGNVIGTGGSYANSGNTIAKVFDGSLSTYFDAPTANGGWAGLDLGAAKKVTRIEFAPRSGWAGRMVGGTFQGSNSADFSGAVTLATIGTTPTVGTLTSLDVTNANGFRYVRYLAPAGGYGNVAEVKFFGTASTATPTEPLPTNPPPTGGTTRKLTGSVIGTPGSYDNLGNTIAKVFDGDLNTFFDSNESIAWAGLDLGSAQRITSLRFAPRASWAASRMVGGRFQLSNRADFADAYTVTQILSTPTDKVLTTIDVPDSTPYRYVRYISASGGMGNIAELEVYGAGDSTNPTPPPPPPTGVPAKLAGSVIGTPGSYDNLGNTIAKVFDGDLNTFFDSNLPIAWAGLDFGVARTITSFRFAPRASWAASRMVGGRFEASNSADFSDSVTLLTITSTPKDKVLTSVEVSTATAYRYFRYISAANGSGNIAELEVYGL